MGRDAERDKEGVKEMRRVRERRGVREKRVKWGTRWGERLRDGES